MALKNSHKIAVIGVAAAASFAWFYVTEIAAQGRSLQKPPVEIALKSDFDVTAADAQTKTITSAALAFLDSLNPEQREAAVFDSGDNKQRSNWPNFPAGPVVRQGVMRGDMIYTQLDAPNTLLKTVMSEDGYRNVVYQLAAEDSLGLRFGGPNFGDEFYYASFLGTPALDAPWMFQFGGHHLAINVTIFGPDLTFSPMLTGGEPLRIDLDDETVYITEKETMAAQTFMDSLSTDQKAGAIRGRNAINLLLGPGEFGTVVAPEGIRGADLSDTQRALLVEVIEARLGFIKADDFAAKMALVKADLDDRGGRGISDQMLSCSA